jgi:hypothetical protein
MTPESVTRGQCEHLLLPNDDSLENCIDHLRGTGWLVPPLPKGADSHVLIMKFEKAITINCNQVFALEVDLGGGTPDVKFFVRSQLESNLANGNRFLESKIDRDISPSCDATELDRSIVADFGSTLWSNHDLVRSSGIPSGLLRFS